MAFGGLGAVYGGYQEAEDATQTTLAKKLANQNTQIDMAGDQALAKGLQLLYGDQGGGQGGAGQPQAAGAAPGQPAAQPVSAQPPVANPGQAGLAGAGDSLQGGGMGAPQPVQTSRITPASDPNNPANWTSAQVVTGPNAGQGGPLTSGPPGGAPAARPPPAAPPPGGAPQTPPGGVRPPPQAGQGAGPPSPEGAPSIGLQQLVGSIVKANKGADPRVLAAAIKSALKNFGPMMNQTDRLQLQAIGLQIREQSVMQREEAIRLQEQKESRVGAQAEERIGQGQQKIDQTKIRDASNAYYKSLQADRAMTELVTKQKQLQEKGDIQGLMLNLQAQRARMLVLSTQASATGSPVDRAAMKQVVDAAMQQINQTLDELARMRAQPRGGAQAPAAQPGGNSVLRVKPKGTGYDPGTGQFSDMPGP